MNTIIEVKCDNSTTLYWREVGTSSWNQLQPASGSPPSISKVSSGVVTFEFVQASGSANTVNYKAAPGDTPVQLPTSGGPTLQLSSGEQLVYFSQASARNPGWYCGYVRVSSSL